MQLGCIPLNRSSFRAPLHNIRSQPFPIIVSSYKCSKMKASRISKLMCRRQHNLTLLSDSQYPPSTLCYIVKLAILPG